MSKLIAGAIESAKRKGIDLSKKKKICVSLDVNGPLTATDSAALEPYPGIKEAIEELHRMGVYIVINSAWDIYTSKLFNEKKLCGVADAIIGENGLVYCFQDKEPVITIDMDIREHVLDLFIKSLNVCSEMEYSFATQGNLVNACYYHEFERGLAENICRLGRPRPNALEFHDILLKNGVVATIIDNGVAIDLSRENCRQLQRILSQYYKLVTIRPSICKGKILIRLNENKDKIISRADLNDIAERVICDLDGWSNYSVNDDFCIDYFLAPEILKTNVTKSTTLDTLSKDICKELHLERKDFLVLGIGDGENDTCMRNIDNALFFGIVGTRSEEDCDFKVASGKEFLHLAKEICQLVES